MFLAWVERHCDVLSWLNKTEDGNGNMNRGHRNNQM